MTGQSKFEHYADTTYAGVRDGAVDREAAFDLACLGLEDDPLSDAARELAEASTTDGNEERLVEAARRFLDDFGYEPGFDVDPERLANAERAMEAVRADIRATGLTGTVRLVFPDWSPSNAFVETWDGHLGSGSGIYPSECRAPVTALVAVADDAQDSLMETIWAAWPVCPVHALGTHPQERDGAGVWWCGGGGGHAVAPIGRWVQ